LGRRHASPWLAGDLGLAWRLTRSLSIGWLAVMFVAGAMYGSIFPDMADFFQNNEMYKQILVGVGGDSTGLVQAFVSFLMCIMAVLAAVPCCMVVMKVKSEEKRGRMEQVLSKSVSRARLFGGYLGIALLLAAALMAACALGIYASAASQMASPPDLGMLFNQAFRYLPALVLLIGLAALLTGAWPQATPLVWIYLVYSFIIMYIGGMLDLPGLLLKVTPFEWLKPLADSLQNNAVQLASTVLVSIIGLVLMVLGAWAYRRRDVG
ncbi:MAG: ABC transporter permease, partial [Actinomycetia bacterium]|nr:ABC transporter permease [Actinomycetes bacterium]